MKVTVDLEAVKKLGVSIEEYVLMEVIASFDAGFGAQKRILAEALRVSERHIFRMIKRLLQLGLLYKDGGVLFVKCEQAKQKEPHQPTLIDVERPQKAKKPPRTKPKGFEYPSEFEAVWKLHMVGDKWQAYRAWWKRNKEGYTNEDMEKAIEIEHQEKQDSRYYRHLSTLLNSDIDELITKWEDKNGAADDDIFIDALGMTFKEAKEKGLI